MEINQKLGTLAKFGHKIGKSGISPDGKIVVPVDGRWLTYPEIDKLLADHFRRDRT